MEEQLARGDFFVCASDKQRDLWLGFLAALGRVNPKTYGDDPTLRRLVDVVPFGLPDAPPVHTRPALRGVVPGIGPDDDVVIWGGGIYDWFDPSTLIRAIDKVRVTRPQVRLYFLGMRHPKPDIGESAAATEARRLADTLGLTGTHVFFNEGWVAYDDRQNYLMEADVGVSLHLEHLETAYSFRTRLLDYLWAGLPVVASAGDGFAEIIAAEGIGTVVPGGDVDAVAQALLGLLSDEQRPVRLPGPRRGRGGALPVVGPARAAGRLLRRAPAGARPPRVAHGRFRPPASGAGAGGRRRGRRCSPRPGGDPVPPGRGEGRGRRRWAAAGPSAPEAEAGPIKVRAGPVDGTRSTLGRRHRWKLPSSTRATRLGAGGDTR